MNDPALIDEMLRKAQTIAVVGMSDKPWRPSHNIGRYLVMQGYRVLPVNPRLKEVHGLKAIPISNPRRLPRRAKAPRNRSCRCFSRV